MHLSKESDCSNPLSQKQSSGLSLPLTDVKLPGQFRQDAFEISATVMPYLLMSHNVQACEPLVSLKVPAAHSVQTPQSMPKYPGSHLQFCSATLAYKDTEFAGHAEQLDGPTVSL